MKEFLHLCSENRISWIVGPFFENASLKSEGAKDPVYTFYDDLVITLSNNTLVMQIFLSTSQIFLVGYKQTSDYTNLATNKMKLHGV